MVKIRIPPLENELYAQTLIEIGRESPSIQVLANRVKKKISSVSEYLNDLEKLECVKRTKNKKLFRNRKEVSINWQGLSNQYLLYLIKEQKIILSKSDIDTYSKNKYLQRLMKLVIRDHQKKYHNTREIGTIYKLFEKLTMQIVYSDVNYSDRIFKQLRKRDYGFKLFRSFTKKIKQQKTADDRKTYAKFLRQIIRDVNDERTSKKNN